MKPWTGGKYRRAFKSSNEMQKKATFEYPIGALHSDIGMNGGSSYIRVFWGKDEADLYNHFNEIKENLDEVAAEMIGELNAVRRKFEKIPFWYQKDLSYTPE